MISKQDISALYEWAKDIDFIHKNRKFTGALQDSYWEGNVWMYPVKGYKKIRKSIMTPQIYDIHFNSDIFTSFLVKIDGNAIALPHRDPPIYSSRFKRLQIPLRVPESNKSYMIYNGETFYWEESVPLVFDVEKVIHEAKNLSEFPVEFLMMDVKYDTVIEI